MAMVRGGAHVAAGDRLPGRYVARAALVLLTVAVLVSALAVVYVKHQTRRLFVELQTLQQERDHMAVEWDRLQLEQGTFATHGRIESIARKQLRMLAPGKDRVVYVEP